MEDETRTCSQCAETKPLGEFPRVKRGEDRRQAYCCACKAVMQKSWYERNKARHIANVKVHKERYIARNRELVTSLKERPCTDCGRRYPPHVMDFDHVRGDKVMDLARLSRKPVSVATILLEIEKCDLVCVNCHRDRTYRRLGAGHE